ncbi:MAG: aminotransferase class V-fold PLP-dependent enzyme, partial [Myxococcales bacterium]|nr:aminotransferase class V-fold PLP-dependent enzyme [Myxococcales bacterium]
MSAAGRVYLDHNATTPVRAEVVDVMTRVLREDFGNPSSVHADGDAARDVIATARAQVATLLGVDPDHVMFTGGATEANNTALCGLLAGLETP